MKKTYINFLKFIAILFVILVHLLSKAWNALDPTTSMFKALTFIDVLFLSSVPIFVMCSGAIFINKDIPLKKLFFKYILRIYIISVIFNSIYLLSDQIVYQKALISFNGLVNILKDSLLLKNILHLWYLKVVICIYLTTPLFKTLLKIKNKYIDYIVLIGTILIVKVLPIFITNITFLNYMYYFGFMLYFYLGYFFDKYKSKKLIIPFTLIFISSYIYTYLQTINHAVIYSQDLKYMQYQSYNIMGVSLIIFILASIYREKFDKEKIKNFFNFNSKYIFFIYLIHGLVIGLLQELKIINIYSYTNLFYLPLYLIYVFIISFILAYIYKYIANKFKTIILKKN